jgi:chorismate-pyruvate lyase
MAGEREVVSGGFEEIVAIGSYWARRIILRRHDALAVFFSSADASFHPDCR